MQKTFDYIISKINEAKIIDAPFKHLYIENFFSEDDFNEVVTTKEINIPAVNNDSELITYLERAGLRYN